MRRIAWDRSMIKAVPRQIIGLLMLMGGAACAEDWGAYAIIPSCAQGMVLEVDHALPSQRWALQKLDHGRYTLTPKHALGMGLDHLGGDLRVGARIDLWNQIPDDQHLQWIIQPLAGSKVTSAMASNKTYLPPTIKPAEVLPGAIKQGMFTQSTIFPGTVREVTVFIPAQYDGSKPACVYVKTDGYDPGEKKLMETMMATGEMPVTVGVFVKPDELPAPMKDTLSRRNRCFEYDAVSEDNVRFLVEELLPFVASQYGLKFATGLAYRPDQWLLSVADGHSKWAYSYQIKDDGTLINKERFFWLQVLDGDDDTGAESVTYAREGQMFVATRSGIQVCADDGPTQVILPLPDRSRATSVCLGGRKQDVLFAFCGDKIWKRRVQVHAMGAFTPWSKVPGTKL